MFIYFLVRERHTQSVSRGGAEGERERGRERERKRERERQSARGEGQREKETQNPKQAPGSELSAQSPTWGLSPQTVRS